MISDPTKTKTAVTTMNEGAAVTLSELAARLYKLLGEKKRTTFIAHSRPDGDTVGSCAGMSMLLRFMGYDADWVCADVLQNRLMLLDDREDHTIAAIRGDWLDDEGNVSIPETELVISLDTAEYKLMGDDYAVIFEDRVDLKLDHHPTGLPFAEYNHIDGSIGSCGELCVSLAHELFVLAYGEDRELPSDASTAFFAAISSDTGSFKYNNATATTHRVAADLMDSGGDSDYVASRLYGQRTPKDIRALGFAFSSVRYHMDGRVAMIFVTNEQKAAFDLTDEDLGEFASIPRDIAGVEVGITVKQVTDKPDNFKVSMRSNGADVSAMCQKLGGGGHVRASGALVVADTPEEAERIILGTVTLDE